MNRRSIPKQRSHKEIMAMLELAMDKSDQLAKGTQEKLFQDMAILALAWTLGFTNRKPLVNKDIDQ